MTNKSELPKNVINPFTEGFLPEWDLWKQYKKEEFNFKYKGVISEQSALMRLATLSGGDEKIAIAIIRQSMENAWKGLFMLPNEKNNNGKSAREKITESFDIINQRSYE